ncbi:FMN-binding glutamate synthase family protein [Pistricoccus aurantiacus]|uniref:FMN-binding glutamate synthase family protein n=1 Tax=Pistricoccus aurantiacus TaxID=1883414 RepID=A0A5B8SLL6_9GAMM|nr:FMN-binding glutamate synthase family protein [Pistricoccus aurantiacus]QEA38012.1 FMN-binding glutamate synthase family protein [Pistricoccus aurantiacus]
MLKTPNSYYPIRYTVLALCVLGLLLVLLNLLFRDGAVWPVLLLGPLAVMGVYDLRQHKHALLRNYPLIGNLRYLLEYIRPEIRQYFMESDTDAAPFSRAQRSLVYQRAKGQTDFRPFGSQIDVKKDGYEWINQSMTPTRLDSHDFRITIGAQPAGRQPRPGDCRVPYEASVFNISAMSFGALSGNAIEALNAGAKRGNFAHDTGEGSISSYHRKHGGDLIWEIGSGYFGCRNDDGSFSAERFARNATDPQVKMIEIKISQGAKPGQGGVMPGGKVTAEIAAVRGIPVGKTCVSPPTHSAFSSPVELLRFVERLRELSGGKPTGFKFCLGHPWDWFDIVKAMMETDITPDFIVVDGAEGGTGASPVEFIDHVGVPLQEALLLVHNTLIGADLRDRVKLGCAGKVISAFDVARTLALGADWCNSARGFMFSLGCIQAQTCHTGNCPTGVTTQDPVRQNALVVSDKAQRVYQFHDRTLLALKYLIQAAGLHHPDDILPRHIVRRVDENNVRLLSNLLPQVARGALLNDDLSGEHHIYRNYWKQSRTDRFGLAVE